MSKNFDRTQVLVVGIAILTAIAATIGGFVFARQYFADHMRQFDLTAYYYFYIQTLEYRDAHGWIAALHEHILRNNRNPFQHFVLLSFADVIASRSQAFMMLNLPALMCFLGALALMIYQASRSVLMVGLGLVFSLCSAFVFDPNFGIVSFAPEASASLFFGAALCSLLASDSGRNWRWMLAFGVFASLVPLCRYVAIAYILFASMPPLLWFLYKSWRDEKSLRPVLMSYSAMTGAVVLLGMPYLSAHLNSVVQFYKTYGYLLGKYNAADAWNFLASFFERFLSRELIFAPLVFLAALLFTPWEKLSKERIFLALWFAVAHALFFVFVLKAPGHYQTPVFIYTSLIVFALSQMSVNFVKRRYLIAILTLIMGFKINYLSTDLQNITENFKDASTIEFYGKIADAVSGATKMRRVKWAGAWAEDFVLPAVLAWERNGTILISKQDYFTDHISHWRGFYPGIEEKEIPSRVYALIKAEVDVLVTREQPWQSQRKFDNPVSEAVARYVSDEAAKDPDWHLHSMVADGPVGPLKVYVRVHPGS